jgi:hypothetical protein
LGISSYLSIFGGKPEVRDWLVKCFTHVYIIGLKILHLQTAANDHPQRQFLLSASTLNNRPLILHTSRLKLALPHHQKAQRPHP